MPLASDRIWARLNAEQPPGIDYQTTSRLPVRRVHPRAHFLLAPTMRPHDSAALNSISTQSGLLARGGDWWRSAPPPMGI